MTDEYPKPMTGKTLQEAKEKMMKYDWPMSLVECDKCKADDGRVTANVYGKWWCYNCFHEEHGK